MTRYVHEDKFYVGEYPKIALRIANSLGKGYEELFEQVREHKVRPD